MPAVHNIWIVTLFRWSLIHCSVQQSDVQCEGSKSWTSQIIFDHVSIDFWCRRFALHRRRNRAGTARFSTSPRLFHIDIPKLLIVSGHLKKALKEQVKRCNDQFLQPDASTTNAPKWLLTQLVFHNNEKVLPLERVPFWS
jgi:hypothetical protein